MTDKELQLKIMLESERDYSKHLKRMVILFSFAFGSALGSLIGAIVILCITKI